ncbi:hypothetical protein VaNZ11_016207 [Volvox africanus]|uniref:Uncharacterized protein n=1 Tax=Volvox africanus TaxID=51714 RepID=A0ABQ5SMU8_9CHLO|nr:hypothetical protein VaNZ11_016207 [Volvox africanus]
MAGAMSNSQAPNATVQGEVLLAKYLTDSIRSIEQAIRKSAPVNATIRNLPRSLSAPRLDLRSDGRRPATEALLPRKFPLSQAPAAAAMLAATRRDDFAYTSGAPGRSGGHVAATQARLLQPAQGGYSSPPPLPPRSHGGGPPLPPKPSAAATAAASLPPRPAVVRTAHAIAAALQQQHQAAYGRSGGGGAAVVRSTSAPRLEDGTRGLVPPQAPTPYHRPPHRHSQQDLQSGLGGAGQPRPGPQSEARIPAVAAAPPLAGLSGDGAAAAGQDVRSVASVRRSAPSDAGTHSSWWRWRPITDASYPLTAITDRYAQSMSPSEVIKWNDRVARLEAEISQEKERRKQFEEQLKKLQVVTTSSQAPGVKMSGAGGAGASGVRSKGGAVVHFR